MIQSLLLLHKVSPSCANRDTAEIQLGFSARIVMDTGFWGNFGSKASEKVSTERLVPMEVKHCNSISCHWLAVGRPLRVIQKALGKGESMNVSLTRSCNTVKTVVFLWNLCLQTCSKKLSQVVSSHRGEGGRQKKKKIWLYTV